MPFRLPEYDLAFARFTHDAVMELARARDPVLQMIRVERTSSTVASHVRDRQGLDVDLPAMETSYEMSTEVAAVREARLDEFLSQLNLGAEQLAEQMVKQWVATVDKVTDATGNVVHGQGKLTFETFLKTLDQIDMSVDENDELIMPTVVMHPDTVAQLPAEPTPEERQRLDELLGRKREEALARRRHRRLS